MIVLNLLGGLGNQMFVWALGRAMESRGKEVSYTKFFLNSDSGRRMLLPDVGIHPRMIDRHIGFNYTEPNLRYHPEVFSLSGDWTIHGYFQCEKYFESIQDTIRSEVFSGMSKSPMTQVIAEQIQWLGDRTCFVHVRRSDNLSVRGLAFHGLTSAQDSTYYFKAMNYVRERVPGVRFFVFSDEPAWCRDCFLRGDDITVVDCNPPSFTIGAKFDLAKTDTGRECEDLWLMSLCHHAIIANSSFSWFGAWLNPVEKTRERMVIAPEPWLADPRKDVMDIVPERWVKVPIK